MKLSKVRTDAAAIVLEATGDDVAVVDHLPDQVAVPAVLVAWGDPMVRPSTLCAYVARLELIVLAGRVEPGAQLDVLETIVGDIVAAFRAAGAGVDEATAPYPIELSGVTYMASSINLTVDVEE